MRTALGSMTEANIDGLSVLERWLDEASQRSLVEAIDAMPWRDDLARRVQHYGWRYDYKARSVDASMKLGALPPWAKSLAERIALERLSAEPEQVIVNEYLPGQGIAAHIDCIPCFGPVVLSLSLGSACTMDLRDTDALSAPVRSVRLEPGSLLVLDRAARTRYSHAIAGRKTDMVDGVRVARHRRVSVTFRTIRR